MRQPLARALVFLPPGSPTLLRDIVEDELNVDEVEAADELSEVLAFELRPQLQDCSARGSASGSRTLQAALATRRRRRRGRRRWTAGRPVVVELADGPVELGAEDVELRVRAQPGFAVSREGAEVVALDLALDEDLRRRGLAREVVRHVQDLRKATGLEVSDRIHLHVVGLDDLGPQFDFIAREVLAARRSSTDPPGGGGRARRSSSTTARRPAGSRSGCVKA